MNAPERWSLVALWWGTAAASALGWGGISHELVRAPGWVPEALVSPLVAGGIVVDVLMGAWLVWRPGPLACRAGLAVVVLFTLLASAMVPGEWLHPFAPLLKNLPIAALLWRGSEWTFVGARR
ncbi:DoxX-like family protein [Hydrogenophaga pseudoflava]|uniref:DoxX-like family protein n=1 Tax=Hydrogenophaga pseudoflava TaxID=47421 RepID=UPI0027E4E523|nr:DoxX-like family protein [Hydrogenophaga pseudoflava]MDQ7743210.1 DoxX-like family protein [Hydrogenophaga pseudoflava]